MSLATPLHIVDVVAAARIPLSTYRLQFNSRFTFANASAIVDYLSALGIGDCYASSYLAAVPGSQHGYDVADPARFNPDIGTDDEYWAWVDEMRLHGMGHVLDVVPNHMGIAKSANPWWQDVLENGASSRYARFFDIEWQPVKAELANKVLIPILGDQYGAVLERQELKLTYAEGSFTVRYFENALPVAPDTYPTIVAAEWHDWLAAHAGAAADELQSIMTASEHLPPRTSQDDGDITVRSREKEVLKRRLAQLTERSADVHALIDAAVARMNGTVGDPRSFDALDALLNAQSYRLAHWRVASEEINYRRFFDVNHLAALRMEDPEVFEEVHRFVFELVRRGAATGLRIDHVDGLFAPGDYLRRLQQTLADSTRPFYIVVEKILGADEQLPREWPVAGTTGYEFASVVNNLFVDRRSERAFDDIYRRFVRDRREHLTFAELAYRSKKQVVHETMSGDINSLGHQLNRFSERHRHFRDFTLYSLISTIKEIIACFPVYRTYVNDREPVSEHDNRYIVEAVSSAKRLGSSGGMSSLVFDFIQRLLLKRTDGATAEECEERARFIGKFQQITGPVAAKGIEDTALYLYNRLISLNEVGSNPTVFGLEPSTVHRWMIQRQQRWPSALSATSTHDTKRGEDVRARLNVLSEIPGAWKAAVSKWRTLNRRHRTDIKGVLAPDPNEEYLIYQTLVGAWPIDAERLSTYATKALRESKVHTSWLSPDEEYEAAAKKFVAGLLDQKRPNPFLQAFLPFQARVAELGIYNSLAQLVIKMTAPGVPDFYQGTEFWDLSLVDPDNRRPVDYDKRRQTLPCLRNVDELLAQRADGRVKMFVTNRGLQTRAALRDVFERGEYRPLETSGARRDGLFAFARILAGDGRSGPDPIAAITCVPRLIASLVPDAAGPPLGHAVWGDTRIELPPEISGSPLCDVFTGATIEIEQTDGVSALAAATVFERFPVALLVPCST